MPTTTAAKAAKKSTAAKATKATSKPPVEDEPDLLAEMPDERNAPTPQNDDDDESYDLLSDMSESSATAWMPWDEDNSDQPDKVQGRIVHIGTVTQDAKYGGDDVPYIELVDRSNPDITWGVRGYATVLRNQLQREIDNGLSNGDIIALAHWGVKTNRKGDNEYRDFTVKSAKGRR